MTTTTMTNEELIKENEKLKKIVYTIINQKYRRKCSTEWYSFEDVMSKYIGKTTVLDDLKNK